MGCSTTRDNPLEDPLTTAQNLLGFQTTTVPAVASAFQTWSVAGFILHKHLVAITHKLNLPLDAPEINAFYSLLKVEISTNLRQQILNLNPGLGPGFLEDSDPVYDKKLMVIVGVLLAKGNNTSKGKAIFEAFDEKCDGQFSEKQLLPMLGDMFKVACELLPTLLKVEEQSAEVKEYLETAQSQISQAAEDAVVLVLDRRRSISVDQFADKLEEYTGSELSTPGGMRKRAYSRKIKIEQEIAVSGDPAAARK